MKRYTYYGNRGLPFEEFIRYANDRYKARKEAVICKIPTEFIPIRDRSGKIISCKVESKSSVDFIGRVKNRPIAIEAKHTSSDNIRWDAVQEHQSQFLTDFRGGADAIAIVLVSFNLERFYAVPWACWSAGRDAWAEAQRKGKRKAEIREVDLYSDTGGFKVWRTNGKASVKESDLLPEWEVKMDGKVGLDYLRRYI